MKKRLHLILIVVLVALLLFSTVLFPFVLLAWGMGIIFGNKFSETFFNPTNLILIFGFILFVIAIFAFFRYVIPAIKYVFKRVRLYISLARLTLVHGESFKIGRFPFASLFGVSKKSDVIIEDNGKTYHLHFIDVVFPNRRVFTLINRDYYCLTKSSPGKIETPVLRFHLKNGEVFEYRPWRSRVFWVSSYVLSPKGERVVKIPEFEQMDNNVHILLMPVKALRNRTVKDGALLTAHEIERVGDFFYCEMNRFKAIVKRDLDIEKPYYEDNL